MLHDHYMNVTLSPQRKMEPFQDNGSTKNLPKEGGIQAPFLDDV
jgi:hypothetical protein